jgi:hypothetical protein
VRLGVSEYVWVCVREEGLGPTELPPSLDASHPHLTPHHHPNARSCLFMYAKLNPGLRYIQVGAGGCCALNIQETRLFSY